MLVGLQQEGHAALLEVEDDRGVPVLGGVHVALRGGGDHQVAMAETCLGVDLDIWVDDNESVMGMLMKKLVVMKVLRVMIMGTITWMILSRNSSFSQASLVTLRRLIVFRPVTVA